MADLRIGRMVVGMMQTNCYFLYQENKPEVLVIDPADSGRQIHDKLSEKGFTVAGILLTHGHCDHMWGARELKNASGAKIYAYEAEKELCEDAGMNLSSQFGRSEGLVPDVLLRDHEKLTVGGITCEVIATPGHTIGSCAYYFEKAKILISGDTLFQGSVGRTDFPTGSESAQIRSIKERLLVLPRDVQVFPGHGDSTSIEFEMAYNPFCQ